MAQATTLRDQVLKSKIYTPAMMEGEEVIFLESTGGMFFVKKASDEEYIKQEGKFMKVPLDRVVDCRVLYLSSFGEKEKEAAIKEELQNLQMQVAEKAKETIDMIDKFDNLGSYKIKGKDDTIGILMNALQHEPEAKNLKKQHELEREHFFKQVPNALEIRDKLKKLLKKKDYNTIHMMLNFEFGKPIATFKIGDGFDLTALLNTFGGKSIEKTIETLHTKGELEVIAKVNVEKRYAPQ